MLYANLEEAYNLTSFDKKKKKKKTVQILDSNINPYDKYEKNEISLPNFDKARDIKNYKTSINHCETLNAPPYKFPIENKAKEKHSIAIDNMNKFNDNSNLFDPDNNIDFDNYLNNIDDYYDNNITKKNILNNDNYKTKNKTNYKTNIKTNNDTIIKENILNNDRTYEIILLIIMALTIIIMCETIVRISTL
jgi:hypothetical protein